MMKAAFLQLAQLFIVAIMAPLLTGLVRKTKARLQGRVGAPIWQPYLDIFRLLNKEAVVAENASWLYRSTPYLTFSAVWLAAALVPSFTTSLLVSPGADLIALVALIASARFWQALLGMDVGTAFGGIGATRELMIASLAEPATMIVIFALALVAGSTSLPAIAAFVLMGKVGLEITLALALIALLMVAIAESGRIPVDNPATHLELTMVHEAMVLECSGRHLALIEAGTMMKLLFYVSLINCIFLPWGLAPAGGDPLDLAIGLFSYVCKVAISGILLAMFETSIAKMRVFRVGEFLGTALLMALLATMFFYLSRGV